MRRTATVLLALALAGCSGATKIESKLAPGASTAGKATFALLPAPEGVGERTPAIIEFLDKRIAPEVAKALEAKGYSAASKDRADLLVAIHASRTGQIDAVRWGYQVVGWEIWGPWYGSMPAGHGVAAYGYTADYTKGVVIFDVVDAKSRTVLYRAYADAVVKLHGELAQDELRAIVAKMLKGYPAAS